MAARDLNTPLNATQSGIPIVEPTTDVNAAQSGELGQGISPSYWDKFYTQVRENFQDSPTIALQRAADQATAETLAQGSGSLKLSPDEANKQFPGLPKPFTDPVYPEVARLIHEENQRRQQRQAWISRGPETGPLFDLAAGAAVGADPLNLIVGSMMPEVKAASLAGRLGGRYATNFAINLLGEVPGLLQRQAEQQQLPSAGQVIGGAAEGAALGTGLHTLIEAGLKRGAAIVGEKDRGLVRDTLDAAIKQHEAGAGIDTTQAASLQAVRDVGHITPGIEDPYQYRELGHPSEVNYYVATDPETGKIIGHEDLGGGIVGVDNKAVANNAAGIPESLMNGKVIQSELSPEANLADAETTLKDFFQSGREKALEKIQAILGIDDRRLEGYRDAFRSLWTGGGTVRDLFNLFQNAATDRVRPYNDLPANDFRNLLDGMGYDGMKFKGKIGENPIDNRVMVFNDQMMKPLAVTDAAKHEVPQYSYEQKAAASEAAVAPENNRWFDQNAKEAVQEKGALNDSKVDVAAIDQNISQAEQNARIDLEQRSLKPETSYLKAELAAADQAYKETQYLVEGVKNLAKCLERTVS